MSFAGLQDISALIKQYDSQLLLLAAELYKMDSSSGSFWHVLLVKGYDKIQFQVNWQKTNSPRITPVVSPITGPRNLNVNQRGSLPMLWSVNSVNDVIYKDPHKANQQSGQRLLVRPISTSTMERSSYQPLRRIEATDKGHLPTSDSGKYYFCHTIHGPVVSCEVCVLLPDPFFQSIDSMRRSSTFWQSHDLKWEVQGPAVAVIGEHLTDVDVTRFLKQLEGYIQGDFLNQEDSIQFDMSDIDPSLNNVVARVIGRGQFSIVFAFDNAMQGLALRRFAGFPDKQEALAFALKHEAGLILYKEMGLSVLDSLFLVVPAVNGYSVYLIQKHLHPTELTDYYLQKFFENPLGTTTLQAFSAGNRRSVSYDMTHGEALIRIICQIIVAIYDNLLNLKLTPTSLSICSDAKIDNYSVRFTYNDKWHSYENYNRFITTDTELTDLHPCTLVFYDQALFDGGPEGEKLHTLLGTNPFMDFHQKIVDLPNAKRLITKVLANFAYHGDVRASEYLDELVSRTRQILLDMWEREDHLKADYQQYKQQFSRSGDQQTNLSDDEKARLARLFFDPGDIDSDTIFKYRDKSAGANLKLKLNYLILQKAAAMNPDFQHQDYIPVDTRQDWWLKVVNRHYSNQLDSALNDRLVELAAFRVLAADKAAEVNINETGATEVLQQLMQTITKDVRLEREASLRQYLDIFRNQSTETKNSKEDVLWHHYLKREFPVLFESLPVTSLEQLKQVKLTSWLEQVIKEFPVLLADGLEDRQIDRLIDFVVNHIRDDIALNGRSEPPTSTTIELTVPGAGSELITRGVSSVQLGSMDINRMLENYGVTTLSQNPCAVHGAYTFNEAYARLHRKSWRAFIAEKEEAIREKAELQKQEVADLLDTLMPGEDELARSLFKRHLEVPPKMPVFPLPETTVLRYSPGLYDCDMLARELSMTLDDPGNPMPSLAGRDTFIQALIATFPRYHHQHKPLVVFDLSHTTKEVSRIRTKPEGGRLSWQPPRIIRFDLLLDSAGHNVVQQTSLSYEQLASDPELAHADFLARVLRNNNEDRWYLLKRIKPEDKPSPISLKRYSVPAMPGDLMARQELSHREPIIYQDAPIQPLKPSGPSAKKSKRSQSAQAAALFSPTSPVGSPVRFSSRLRSELEKDNRQKDARKKIDRMIRQFLQQETQAEMLPTASDNFCLFNALATLLQQHSKPVHGAISTSLWNLLDILPDIAAANDSPEFLRICQRFYRNIIFLLMKNKAAREKLLTKLFELIDSTANSRALYDFLAKLLTKLKFHYFYLLPAEVLDELLFIYNSSSLDSDTLETVWTILSSLFSHSVSNTNLEFLLSSTINEFIANLSAGTFQTVMYELSGELVSQWNQPGSVLQPNELFFGMGVHALNNWLSNPSDTQAAHNLQNFLPENPGNSLWGDIFLLQDLLLPLLQSAGLVNMTVMVLSPNYDTEAYGDEQSAPPFSAQLLPANHFFTATADIASHLHNPNTLTLINSGGTSHFSGITAGDHWQPVVPSGLSTHSAGAEETGAGAAKFEQQSLIDYLTGPGQVPLQPGADSSLVNQGFPNESMELAATASWLPFLMVMMSIYKLTTF